MEIENIDSYEQLREILNNSNWQKFERIVGTIFELNGYQVQVSEVVSFENTKRQYDVIAENNSHAITVDCKKWDNKRRIKHGLKKAVKNHIERSKKLPIERENYPIIVTSNKTPIEYSEKVPIIPVHKTNQFISKFQANKEKILKV